MTAAIQPDVKIVEVGPRDGLQNEQQTLTAAQKIQLVHLLAASGLPEIECGSFVSPKWVPQMANSAEVFHGIDRHHDVIYSALTPNLRGLEQAIDANVQQVAVFASASEAFSHKNINCSIDESIERFTPVLEKAKQLGIPVRAYLSCVMGCPYEGPVAATQVEKIAERLLELGCFEVSLGDTIGVGTAFDTKRLLQQLTKNIPSSKLALHCHDTYGQALANIYAALKCDIRTFDASVSGLGGCPYAKGASGNVATEDLVYMLQGAGLTSGVDLDLLIAAGRYIDQQLGRQTQSKVARARHPLNG